MPTGSKRVGVEHRGVHVATARACEGSAAVRCSSAPTALAHSISLALVSLGWIVVPAPPVEAVVALSIMFLAVDLLRDPNAPRTAAERYPWIVAFAFWHGLGFARALLDIGLPRDEITASSGRPFSVSNGRPFQ